MPTVHVVQPNNLKGSTGTHTLVCLENVPYMRSFDQRKYQNVDIHSSISF